MSRLLITGADGFVGRWLTDAAVTAGHEVVASLAPGIEPPAEWASLDDAVEVVHADITQPNDLTGVAERRPDAVVHLAAVASGSEARRNPTSAWMVNAAGTAALADALASVSSPRFLLVSTGEVYGREHADPIAETAAIAPCSPYAASKAAAELAALEVARRTGMEVVIARPFPHTGPGQAPRFVLPAFASRLRTAAATGATSIKVGDLTPVRDFLDVRDVVRAYLLLLEHGQPGEAYNVASGTGHSLDELFVQLQQLVGTRVATSVDPSLLRRSDIPRLIGDPGRLKAATGWSADIPLTQTLRDLVDAQAD